MKLSVNVLRYKDNDVHSVAEHFASNSGNSTKINTQSEKEIIATIEMLCLLIDNLYAEISYDYDN